MMRVLLLLVTWLLAAPVHAASRVEQPEGWHVATFTGGLVMGDESDQVVVEKLAAHAEEALPRLAAELGIPPQLSVSVTVAPSEVLFRDMQPGRAPTWADGTAWPNDGLIFLRSPRLRPGPATPLSTVFDHELVHVLMGQAFGDRPVPTWLQEGVAKVMAREVNEHMTDALAGAMLTGRLLSLEEITSGFPSEPGRAQLAYAQSTDLVAFIRNHWGKEALQVVIQRMAQGEDVDTALRAATGLGPTALDAAWRGRLLASPLWLKALAQPGLWLGAGSLFFVVAGLFRLRRTHKKFDQMVQQDAIEDRRREEALMAALARRVPPYAPPLLRYPPDDGPGLVH